MTKKDYIALARIMSDNRFSDRRRTWNNIYDALADMLERDNPKFDRAKFQAACLGR